MSNFLDLSCSLRTLVTNKFIEAKSKNALVFSETQLATLQDSSKITYQLRYCPSLAKKPIDNKTTSTEPAEGEKQNQPHKPKINPFASPSSDLLMIAVPTQAPSHNLILNKFPIIPYHFILATLRSKPQTDLLEPDDLFVAYQCVRAWPQHHNVVDGDDDSNNSREDLDANDDNSKHELFAFFNSGPESGASQPHRHLQFLPVEAMAEQEKQSQDASSNAIRNGNENTFWTVLSYTMTRPFITKSKFGLLYNPSLPVVHFALDINKNDTAADLERKYHILLLAAHASIASSEISGEELENVVADGLADIGRACERGSQRVTFSYNFAITSEKLVILPRRAGDVSVKLINANEQEISVNGTILAGTLMVKDEQLWEEMKAQPELLRDVVGDVGYKVTAMPKNLNGRI